MNPDDIRSVSPGDLLSAARDEEILQALRRKLTAGALHEDNLGWHLFHGERRRIARFEMLDELLLPQSGAGSAMAYLQVLVNAGAANLVPAYTEPVKVVDIMRMHSKMATVEPDVGAYGLCWIPDDPPIPYGAHWEILTMQTPGPFFGVLDSPLTRDPGGAGYDSATATVYDVFGKGHRTLWGYDPFGPGWAGGEEERPHVTVYNPPRQNPEEIWPALPQAFMFDLAAGRAVFCMWHMRENKYYAVSPMPGITVTGSKADMTPATGLVPCWSMSFNSDDFILTVDADSPGEVIVSLR